MINETKSDAPKKEVAPKKATVSGRASADKKAGTAKATQPTETHEVIEKVTGDVVSTSIFSPENVKAYEDYCNGIDKEIGKVNISYLAIATKVYAIRHKKLFQIENYANVYDMAQEKYGFSRGTCNNYINICEKFGKIDEKTAECSGLLPQYKGFSSSQLVEMLQVPKKHLGEFTPDMSVREMRRKKGICKEKGVTLDGSKEVAGTSAKKKKLELLKASDISEVLESGNTALKEKLAAFEQEHPEAAYNISITLVYEE